MRCKERKFYEGEPQHIYQRTIGGFNIFYDDSDYLVFYTVISTSAKKLGVKIWGLCLMIDHIHILIEVNDKKTMSDFVCHYSSIFVKEYNRGIGRCGRLLEKAFGNAPKRTDKKIRSAILYLFNNPVEKKLCRSAQNYRWNFLAYAVSKNPFSEYSNLTKSSKALRKAINEVKNCRSNGWHLKYKQLDRLFKGLSRDDRNRLIDFIIVSYSPFDYKRLVEFYGDYQSLIIAADSSTGSEYDIMETYYQHSDTGYYDMISYLHHKKGMKNIRKATILPNDEKVSLARELRSHTNASFLQIKKFLHIV